MFLRVPEHSHPGILYLVPQQSDAVGFFFVSSCHIFSPMELFVLSEFYGFFAVSRNFAPQEISRSLRSSPVLQTETAEYHLPLYGCLFSFNGIGRRLVVFKCDFYRRNRVV